MEGGNEVNVTGVGVIGVGSTGVQVEVCVGGVPPGWIEAPRRRHRRGTSKPSSQVATTEAANATKKRPAVDLSRSPSQQG